MTLPRAALLAVAAVLAGFSPFEREEENVRAGNARLHEGDPAGARSRFDDAERAVGPRPEIEFDRGHAALQEGRPEEAEAAWRRAAEDAPGALASRALQNVGTARAEAGDRAGAVRAFSEALVADPSNDDARWNLEVLLRKEADDAGGAQGGRRAPAPEPATGRDDPAAAPNGARERAPPRETPAAADPGATANAEDEERRADGAKDRGKRAPRSRQEAEALLDALRAGEKDPPLFGRERRDGRRSDGAKDW